MFAELGLTGPLLTSVAIERWPLGLGYESAHCG